jgi:bifunctional non-homologous end joining protein LigD
MPRAFVEGHSPRGSIDYLMAQDAASLMYIANLGCIEMHPLHSRQFDVGRPDYAFFDLDPFPPIEFSTVRRVALMVKVACERLGLTSYPRTSGATGMQIYIPLDGSHSYDEARAVVERVCRLIHRTWPDGTTMEWEVAKRAGKVFLDYAMVSEGRNIGAVYSVRAKPGAPVSTPLLWEELGEKVRPRDYGMREALERVERHGDLFEPVLRGGQSLGPALRALMVGPATGHEPHGRT